MTQMEYAGKGVGTPEMKHIANVEHLPEETILQGVAVWQGWLNSKAHHPT